MPVAVSAQLLHDGQVQLITQLVAQTQVMQRVNIGRVNTQGLLVVLPGFIKVIKGFTDISQGGQGTDILRVQLHRLCQRSQCCQRLSFGEQQAQILPGILKFRLQA